MAKQTFNSTQLRRLAEMADGLRGIPYASMNKARMWMSRDRQTAPDTLSIPVNNRDVVQRRRCITEITIHLDNGQKIDLYKIGGFVPDALFWTESAVQKFLVPYYAAKHAADPRVPGVIRTLLNTFNGKARKRSKAGAGSTVEVFAMAHLPKSEYTSETDEVRALDNLAVLHVAGGRVRVESLPAYLAPPKK